MLAIVFLLRSRVCDQSRTLLVIFSSGSSQREALFGTVQVLYSLTGCRQYAESCFPPVCKTFFDKLHCGICADFALFQNKHFCFGPRL